jgi:hypothetical protein
MESISLLDCAGRRRSPATLASSSASHLPTGVQLVAGQFDGRPSRIKR